MDVSRKVLDNVALYLQWHDTQAAANMLGDKLAAILPHMTPNEAQAYEHMTEMVRIANHENPLTVPRNVYRAESVPMPALTPERLAAMDTEAQG